MYNGVIMIKAALQYLKMGFSIIPVQKNKKPLIAWEQFQKRRATEQEVRGWFKEKYESQIAIVTGSISGLVVIDIDDPTAGEIDRLIPEELTVPTAATPGGGFHLYFKAPSETMSNNTGTVKGCDFRGEGGYVVAPPSAGYTWMPGRSIFDVTMPSLPLSYISYVFSNALYRGNVTFSANAETPTIPKGLRDETIFHHLNQLVKGGASEAEVRKMALVLAKSCVPPFPEKELEAKIQSVLKRDVARKYPMISEIEGWISLQDGDFSVTECRKSLQAVTNVTDVTVRQAVHRLKEKGIIEKSGKKSGVYRRVERDYEIMDLAVEGEPLNLEFPLGIHEWVHIMPKNIIVIAGQSNAGKTAYLLSFLERNMANHQFRYLSSEMGPLELKSRLIQFQTPLSAWPKCFIERATSFADLVLPDGITIIDYLEVSDEFYKIGGTIKEIFDRLNTGIALIALQKNPGTDLGRGGTMSLEKARLYLSMDSGILKIVKGKNWASPLNPNGLTRRFKLVGGAKFIPEDVWRRE